MSTKIILEIDTGIIKDFNKFKQEIRKEVIENGLDISIKKSLKDLKNKLLKYINEDVKATSTTETQQDKTDKEKPAEFKSLLPPKSDQELIKHITGIDIFNVKPTDHTQHIDQNAFVINNNRVRLRIPEISDGTIETSYAQALEKFNNAIFIEQVGPNIKYLFAPSFDVRDYTKLNCSRDTGITDKSKKVFDSYKNSKKRSAYKSNPGEQRHSEWTLLQEGVRSLKRHSIDITSVIELLKQNKYEEAVASLRTITPVSSSTNIENKILDLKEGKGLTEEVSNYSNLTKTITGLIIKKQIRRDTVSYQLNASYTSDTSPQVGATNVEEVIRYQLFLWAKSNENMWLESLTKKINLVIKKFLKSKSSAKVKYS